MWGLTCLLCCVFMNPVDSQLTLLSALGALSTAVEDESHGCEQSAQATVMAGAGLQSLLCGPHVSIRVTLEVRPGTQCIAEEAIEKVAGCSRSQLLSF